MSDFKIFSHTADIGLEVQGKTREDLFRNAALGLLSILTDPSDFGRTETVRFKLEARTWEDLLVAWLEEILYFFTVKAIGFRDFKITSMSPTRVQGIGAGERIDLKKHRVDREVKAVTYHDLKIEKTRTGYKTRIILDI